jgi:hypothetical protein
MVQCSTIILYGVAKAKRIYEEYDRVFCIRYDLPITTITFGSILKMKIRDVKKDSSDYSLAIPSAILPGLNADFDGDELNTIALEMEEFWELFDGFSPTNMIINRTTGNIRYDISSLENISIAILRDR